MVGKFLNLSYLKFIFIFSLIFSIFVFFYFPTYTKLKRLREEEKQLNYQIDRLKVEIEKYQQDLERIKKDNSFYEHLARDMIGVARRDEIVIDIEE